MLKMKMLGVNEAIKRVRKDVKQAKFAGMKTLNNLAKKSQEAQRKEMKSIFDRPTPFILRSLRITQWAKKEDLETKHGFKTFGKSIISDPVTDTIMPHIEGGARRAKGSERTLRRAGILRGDEFLVPSRTAKLDRYGNIRKGTMGKILADLNAHTAAGYTSNRKASAKRQYMIGQVGNTRGIFKIQGGTDKADRGRWSLIFLVVRGAPKYKKRYDFYGIAKRVFNKNFDIEYSKQIKHALATAKR